MNIWRKIKLVFFIRDEILIHASGMEEKLRRHDNTRGRTGWLECDSWVLDAKLSEEVEELSKAMEALNTPGRIHPEYVIEESIDVANVAMMIGDRVRKHGII
jgi:hypothetical protein